MTGPINESLASAAMLGAPWDLSLALAAAGAAVVCAGRPPADIPVFSPDLGTSVVSTAVRGAWQ